MSIDPAKLAETSLEQVVRDLRDSGLSAEALAEACIAAHDNRGDSLHAYKTWAPDKFRAEAQAASATFAAGIDLGALQGIPVAVKDLYGVSGYPTFAGAAEALPARWQTEGPVVRALRHQLAPVSGKTHTVEFAFGGIGSNVHWGTPRNPWDASAHRVPGGSSSGSGVSLWEGSALLALGSDTAGSVRVPASATGTVGIKTTYGRWSLDGIVPLSPTLDTAGLFARSVADAVIGFSEIDPQIGENGVARLDRFRGLDISGLTVGILDWFFDGCESGIDAIVEQALKSLEPAGIIRQPFVFEPVLELERLFRSGGLAAAEFATFINTEMVALKDKLDPVVRERFSRMEGIPAIEYLARRQALGRLAAMADQQLRDVDVLVAPTIPITPPRLDDVATVEAYSERNMLMLRNTVIGNFLSLCGVTIPAGLDQNGMPVGLMIMGPHGQDERVIAVALAFERHLGTARDRLGVPPLCTV